MYMWRVRNKAKHGKVTPPGPPFLFPRFKRWRGVLKENYLQVKKGVKWENWNWRRHGGWGEALRMHAGKVKSSYLWVAVRVRDVEARGGHFPSAMDRLLTFWLAAGLTPPVRHWALSIPQHPQTAHKFWGPGMNSASQHPLKGLHRSAIKKNSSSSLTLISSLAKSHRSKWLGTLHRGRDAECWQPSLNIFFGLFCSCSCCWRTQTWLDAMISVISFGGGEPAEVYLTNRTFQTSTLFNYPGLLRENKIWLSGFMGAGKRADLFYLPLHMHQCNDDKTGC